MFTVYVKSGTSGHSDFDGCDMILAEMPSTNIPQKGDILKFGDSINHNIRNYLVTEVSRQYNRKTDNHVFGEFISVYVIKM